MTNGAKSQFPLVRLASKYREMMRDGNVLSNRNAVNLVDARITQLLERVDVQEAPDRVAKLYNLWLEFTSAEADGREKDRASARMSLDAEFEKVYHDYNAWKQIFEALDLRGRLTAQEVKTLGQLGMLITMERAYEMAAQMLGASMKVIGDDPGKLKELQYEFIRITGERSDIIEPDDSEDDRGGGSEGDRTQGPGELHQEEFLHPRDEE